MCLFSCVYDSMMIDPKCCHHCRKPLKSISFSVPWSFTFMSSLHLHSSLVHRPCRLSIHKHTHHPLSSSLEWAVPSYLAFLHPHIYNWCNGALYLNAALFVTSTWARRDTGKQASGCMLVLGQLRGRVAQEMNERTGRWLSRAGPDTLNCS